MATMSKDHKIIAYELHYIREAISYLREGKLDECQKWLALLDKRINTLALTLAHLIKEKNI